MKYFLFFTIALLGIPAMAWAALASAKARGWLLTLLIFSTALGDYANINFLSMENYRGPDRGFEVNLTDLVTIALAAALCIKFPRRLEWFPSCSSLMAASFILCSIAAAGAPDRLLASFTLVKLVKCYLLFWTIVNAVQTGTDKKYLWWSFASIGLFFFLFVLKQKYLAGLYRVSGTFDHSNTVPLYLNLILPSLLMWGLTDKALARWKAYLSIAVALGMVFAVVATFSRAGTAISGLCVLAVLLVANLRARSRRVTLVSLVTLLAVLGGAVKASKSFLDRIKSAPESSEAARVEFNIAAAMMAREHWMGVGLNNFSRVLSDTPHYRDHITVMKDEQQAGVAHHIYWLTAAETGYLGLATFIAMISGVAVLAAWRGFRSRSFDGNLLIGLFIGFLALYMSGFLEWAMRITPVTYMFYINCGLCVGLAGNLRRQQRDRALWVASGLPARAANPVRP